MAKIRHETTDESSEYKEEYDAIIVQMAKNGKFLYEIATELGYTLKCLWGWSKRFPTFAKAYALAKDIQAAKLMRELFDMRHDRMKNTRAVEFVIERLTGAHQFSTINIAGLNSKNVGEKLSAVMSAAGDGEIRADQLKMLVESIKTAHETQFSLDTLAKIKQMLEAGKTKELIQFLSDSIS